MQVRGAARHVMPVTVTGVTSGKVIKVPARYGAWPRRLPIPPLSIPSCASALARLLTLGQTRPIPLLCGPFPHPPAWAWLFPGSAIAAAHVIAGIHHHSIGLMLSASEQTLPPKKAKFDSRLLQNIIGHPR